MLIITSHDKVITNYVSFAYYELPQSVFRNCDCFFIINYEKSSYTLRQVLQIATAITVIITIYEKTIVKFSTKHFG